MCWAQATCVLSYVRRRFLAHASHVSLGNRGWAEKEAVSLGGEKEWELMLCAGISLE